MSSQTKSTEHLALGIQELEDGEQCFKRAFSKEIKPPAVMSVSEWADKYRIVSAKGSSESGRWRTSRTPYLKEIMDELSDDSSTTDVVFKKGTQVGGTECGLNWIGYIIDYSPAPTMVIWPTSNTAKRNSKQRLTPLIDETPVLSRKVQPARSRESGNTVTMKEFSGGVLAIAGANSAAELKSMPAKNLLADEIDEYPDDVDGQGDPLKLAEKRTSNFRAKRYKCSSPTVDGFSRIDDEWKASDQRHYYVPCPDCKKKQWLKWDQMRWEMRKVLEYICLQCGVVSDGCAVEGKTHICPECKAKEKISKQNLIERETDELVRVWYECEHCQFAISEHHKTWMLEHGEWIAENSGPDRAAGFQLSALYSPLGWFSWREAVKDYIVAKLNEVLMKVFTNTVLGETYVDKTAEQPDKGAIQDRAEPYRLGTVPAGGMLLVAAVDVQGNRLEVKLKAYGRNEESWLVDYHVIFGDPEDDTLWSTLDDYLKKSFPHEYGSQLRISATAIDSGYKTQKVYDFCRQRTRRHVFAIKGMAGDGKPVLGSPTVQDIDYRGKKIKKGVKLWPVGTHAAKSLIYGRLKKLVDPDTDEEIERPDRMHFPLGLSDDYYDQLTVEKLVTFYNKAGQARREWRKKPNERNETLDLEVYCYAAAIYAGVKRKNWDQLEKKLNLNQSDMFNQSGQGPEHKGEPVATETETVEPTKQVKKKTRKRRARRGGFVNNY